MKESDNNIGMREQLPKEGSEEYLKEIKYVGLQYFITQLKVATYMFLFVAAAQYAKGDLETNYLRVSFELFIAASCFIGRIFVIRYPWVARYFPMYLLFI